MVNKAFASELADQGEKGLDRAMRRVGLCSRSSAWMLHLRCDRPRVALIAPSYNWTMVPTSGGAPVLDAWGVMLNVSPEAIREEVNR